ncbi:MAG: pentapeptide repeat-containing protein [Caldilineaceae bacterium]|nr:pentapeptide repeat-containing protein [Caldilineaceae bacterium]
MSGDDSPGATIRNVVLVLASIVALPLAVWRSIIAHNQATAAQNQASAAHDQLALAERDSLDARYQKGADMLSSENISTRIGGVYALKLLAENHPGRFHIQVMELLCAFVRHPYKAKDNEEPHVGDVTAAVETIIHRSDDAIAIEEASRPTPEKAFPDHRRASEEGFRVNLKDADLSQAALSHAKLRGAVLDNVTMPRFVCDDADFSGSSMSDCKINHAMFFRAAFDKAQMNFADMSKSSFFDCSFVETEMGDDLSESSLEGANLIGAIFSAANLNNTNLENADLSGTIFERLELKKNEPFCKVTQRQLDSAMANPDDPPQIEEGTIDIETGKPIVWNHKLCGDRWLEHQKSRDSM